MLKKILIAGLAVLLLASAVYLIKSYPLDADRVVIPSETPKPAASIIGKEWKWVVTKKANGDEVKPKQVDSFTVTFSPDQKINGKTDCNSFFGEYEMENDRLSFASSFGSTKMYCQGSQEDIFKQDLRMVESYSFDAAGNLVLQLQSGAGLIVLSLP